VVSRPGQGTRIGARTGGPLLPAAADRSPLRRAALVHQAEAFLLEVLAAGYNPAEAEAAFRAALDRWRALAAKLLSPGNESPGAALRGSHDPAVSLLAARFPKLSAGCVWKSRSRAASAG